MVSRELIAAYRFFKEHAGYAVGRRAAGALALARAERTALRSGWTTEWEGDDDADMGEHEYWCAGARRDQAGYRADGEEIWASASWRTECPGHYAEAAILHDERGEIIASLGGILDADYNYRRVIEAEMALEALHDREKLEAMAS